MAAFDPTTHNLIVSAADSEKPKHAVPAARVFQSMLATLGFESIEINTVAPSNVRVLWYNKDTDQFRRYNPLTAAWSTLVPTQWFLHILQLAFRSAGVEGVADNADKLPFFDVSADETKMITMGDLKASLGVTGWVQYDIETLVAPATYFELDLPTAFKDFLLVVNFTLTGSATYPARMIGIYPTDAQVDITGDFTGGQASPQHWWYSGDRSDLTGVIWRQKPQGSGTSFPIIEGLSNRIAKIRYSSPRGNFGGWPTDTWQFATGSVAKLFVR